jgi:RimJ/RimL family protein N-acetyltransferase
MIKSIKYEFEGFKFYLRNMAASRRLGTMRTSKYEEFLLSGLTKDLIPQMDGLHRLLRDGRSINFWRKSILRRKGPAVCCAAIDGENVLIGFDYYYFREEEVSLDIIHEAFIGISPDQQSKGIATALRNHMVSHFAEQGLRGISTQIDHDNVPSIKSALKAGFQVCESGDVDDHIKLFYDFSEVSG